MKPKTSDFKQTTRKSVFTELEPFDVTAEKHGFIEVSEWSNQEGFDVYIHSFGQESFKLTYRQFEVLKKAVKALDKS